MSRPLNWDALADFKMPPQPQIWKITLLERCGKRRFSRKPQDALMTALLYKSGYRQTSPFPVQTYPATSEMGVPSAVKPLRTATRTWNSATWRSKSRADRRCPRSLTQCILVSARLQRFIMGGPVPGLAGRGCWSAHAAQLPRWIPERNPLRDLRKRALLEENCAAENKGLEDGKLVVAVIRDISEKPSDTM
jgi:hypothetical protein